MLPFSSLKEFPCLKGESVDYTEGWQGREKGNLCISDQHVLARVFILCRNKFLLMPTESQ